VYLTDAVQVSICRHVYITDSVQVSICRQMYMTDTVQLSICRQIYMTDTVKVTSCRQLYMTDDVQDFPHSLRANCWMTLLKFYYRVRPHLWNYIKFSHLNNRQKIYENTSLNKISSKNTRRQPDWPLKTKGNNKIITNFGVISSTLIKAAFRISCFMKLFAGLGSLVPKRPIRI
jgi:hypothetical protein